jgi:AAA domain-containing protein
MSVQADSPQCVNAAPPIALEVVNAYDLYIKDLPPTNWILKPIIHEGATLLTGDPKVGKSFLALQIALAVASGEKCFFDSLEVCTPGRVLYLALDDGSEKRLHNRLRGLQVPEEATRNLDFVYQRNLPDLSNGFVGIIHRYLEENKYVLVILDTFGAVMGRMTGKSIYREEYQEAIKLQKLAQQHGIALLILHHTNKGEGTDVIARASGSHGLTGAVDSVLMLSRQKGGALLAARPRDAEESAYSLERLTNGGWRLLDQAAAIAAIDLTNVCADEGDHLGPKQQAVLALLREGRKSYQQVAPLLGISEDAARKRLERMAKSKLVRKNPDGTFEATA